tara:strand:+ start:166 stop:1530 length:1365 start_codon:yes stop_codon:yes gene_type:complete
MSDKFELNEKYIAYLSNLIHNKDNNKINSLLKNVHPSDIADILEALNESEAQFLFELIEKEKSANVIVEVEDEVRDSLLSELSEKEIAKEVIDNLESDDAADLIGDLSDEKQEKVLSYIEDEEYFNTITDLLSYQENSAGSLMAKELIAVNENWSTKECLIEMRKQATKIKKIHTVYVVNNSNELVGTLSLRQLLISESNTQIEKIVKKNIVSIKATESHEIVANTMNKYNLVVLPVIDDENKLIGRITADDVMEIIKEEAEKDYQMASGITEDVDSSDNIWLITRARLPWLLIGLLGGVFGAGIINGFEITNQNLQLAFFIPLIAAMGGNVGVQSAAIIVQGLANNSLKANNLLSRLLKELIVAIINGLICSLLIFATILLFFPFDDGFLLAISVSISLLTVIIFAALFGTFIPIFLYRNRIDPALATGPFITTVNDVFGLFIYFYISIKILT